MSDQSADITNELIEAVLNVANGLSAVAKAQQAQLDRTEAKVDEILVRVANMGLGGKVTGSFQFEETPPSG